MVLAEEGYDKDGGEWISKAERQCKKKKRATEGTKAKEEMDKKVEPRVRFLRFHG